MEQAKRQLNLEKINEYLTREITPKELAGEFDDLIFNINLLYGYCDESAISISEYSEMIYRLKTMRDLFTDTGCDNPEN